MTGTTLRIDEAAWRTSLDRVRDATPGLVPVAKGNGYGFGLPRLAEEATRLGADTIAVGTPGELDAVADRFPGTIVVLTPWPGAPADDGVRSLTAVPPDEHDPAAARLHHTLRHLGWKPPKDAAGFAAGQPKFNFWLPLKGRSADDVLKGMNQLWRRNIKKAAKLGVEVSEGGPDDLGEFHRIYVETAERDGFTPRALSYFQNMCPSPETTPTSA